MKRKEHEQARKRKTQKINKLGNARKRERKEKNRKTKRKTKHHGKEQQARRKKEM